MNDFLRWTSEKHAEIVIANLQRRNINGYLVKTPEEAREKILSLINKEDLIAWSGSTTLNETGIKETLRKNGYRLIDTDQPELPREESLKRRREGLLSDVYLTSTNAITIDGSLVNIDGFGNRVSAMICGPKKVILVTGTNKIVSDEETALDRIKTVSAPANAKRLGKKTPCAESGLCSDCDSPERICSAITIIERQVDPARMHIILVPQNMGF